MKIRLFWVILISTFSPLLSAAPCDNVLFEAEQANTKADAEFLLGGCLASPGPIHIQLQAASKLLDFSSSDPVDIASACQYTAIIQQMLEYTITGLDSNTLAEINAKADQQACYCDRHWARSHTSDDSSDSLAPSWFGSDIAQRLLYQHADSTISASPLEMFVHARLSMDHLCIFQDDKLLHTESRGSVTSGFERGEFYTLGSSQQPAAVLIWRAGVHGEAIQVRNLVETEHVWERRSDWPIEYRLESDQVFYTRYLDDAHDTGVIYGDYDE